jgi:hypothetical protein
MVTTKDVDEYRDYSTSLGSSCQTNTSGSTSPPAHRNNRPPQFAARNPQGKSSSKFNVSAIFITTTVHGALIQELKITRMERG